MADLATLDPSGDADMEHRVQIYVFYHDAALLQRSLKGRSPDSFGPNFRFIDLNLLPLPEEARIPGLEDSDLNRAMLSEYLGILSVDPPPEVTMVGTFTYSIPLKFSPAWALETGNTHLFLPEVDFSAIEALLSVFEPHYLYGVEFKDPLSKDRGPVRLLAEQRGGIDPEARGPYKGSLICSRDRFLELQAYLRQVLPTILGFEEQQLEGVHNPFSAGAVAGRAPERAELDRRRSTYGNAVERAMALFFSGKEHRRLQIRLGDLVRRWHVSSDPMLQAAHRGAFHGNVVLTFCSESSLPMLQRWLGQARQAGIRGLMVVCFDAATSQFCQEQKIAWADAELPFTSAQGELWRYQQELTLRILKTGLSVLQSDLHACWLENPMPRLQKGDAHLVALQDVDCLPDLLALPSIALCCGFLYFRYSAAAIICLEQLCLQKSDDSRNQGQDVFNAWLWQQAIQWQIPSDLGRTSLPIPGSERFFTAYDDDLEGETSAGLRVRLLAHRDFQRVLDASTRPIVSYLSVPQQNAAKLETHALLDQLPARRLTVQEPAPSTLVWLASYPRSGNTMLRTWLKHCFGLQSCSVYNDEKCIGRDPHLRAITGHYDRDWFYGHASRFMSLEPDDYAGFNVDRQLPSGIEVVKTHGIWNAGYERDSCIYIVRDGRNALTSYAHYRLSFARDREAGPASDQQNSAALRRELEELIICGRPQCGSWSDNVNSFVNQSMQQRGLHLRFEEVIQNQMVALKRIETFLARPMLAPNPPEFKKLQTTNKSFFRTGMSDLSPEFNDPFLQSLFFAFEWQGMLKYGYIKGYEWFVVDRSLEPAPMPVDPPAEAELLILRYIRLCITTYKHEIHPFNKKSFLTRFADIATRCLRRLGPHLSSSAIRREADAWQALQTAFNVEIKP